MRGTAVAGDSVGFLCENKRMWAMLTVGIGLICFGVRRLGIGPRFESDLPRLSLTHAVAAGAAWISGGILLVIAGIGTSGLAWLTNVSLLLCLVGISVAWLTARLENSIRSAEVGSISTFFVVKAQAAARNLKASLGRSAKTVAPTGWSELQLGVGTLDRVVAPRTLLLVYVAGLAVLPIVLAVVFTYAVRGGSAAEQRILSAVFGYNALFVVSCLTAATLVCVLILIFMRFTKILLINLDVARAFRAVATWTGYGTAAGAITAAMLPVVNAVVPLSASSVLETDLAAVINPDLLIDLPAAGAVVGYGIGLTVAIVTVCRNAQNLIIRRILSPLLFILIIGGLRYAGLDPERLFTMVANSAAASLGSIRVDCSSEASLSAFVADLGEAPWVLHVLAACNIPFMIGGQIFVAAVCIFVSLLALISLAVDFRRGMKNTDVTAMQVGHLLDP